MKTAACFVLLSAILAPGLLAQTQAPPAAMPPQHYIRISAGVAEKLLKHKTEPVLSQAAMEARGTVVMMIAIDKNGNVLYPKVISGPALLSNPVLDAVRKYKYKPYLINGKAVVVETTVSVTMNY
jgi:protein TonB